MKNILLGKARWMRGIIWVICLLMVAPPAVLAQMQMQGGAQMGGVPPGGPAATPGQATVTNPTALQPIAMSQAPCPGFSLSPVAPLPAARSSLEGVAGQPGTGRGPLPQPGSSQASPGFSSDPLPDGGQGASGTRPGGLGPAPGAMRTEASGMTSQGGAALPGHPGLLSPIIQQQGEVQQSEVTGPLTIEQNFARFFILEGVTDQLKQFGYNFFDVQFSGLLPVLDVPVGPDYVLGPDDSLAVYIWNVPDPNFNRSYIAPIERDGTMFIPQVGSIPLAGSTFSQATSLIHARLSNLLKRFELHVSMARLRTMKVYVVGEVIRPGSYEVSSLATASHALYAACGPAKSGSLRHIRVVRDGKTVSELDFYRFFIDGDRTHDVRLHSGDTLVVPPIGQVAAIGGPVKRQAIYELAGKTTLTELIELAGGLLPTSDRRRCQIFRVEAGRQRVVLDIDLSNLMGAGPTGSKSGATGAAEAEADPLVQDGDFIRLVSVSTQIENAVSLAGAVRNPGPYEFKAGMRLRDLLTPERVPVDSYLDRAELIRTDPVTFETTVIPFSPKKLFQGVTEENMELRRLDKVMVASQVKPPRMVTVSGEVNRPGTYTVEGGERLSSVLARAGGFTLRAFPQGIVLVRESVQRSQQTELEKFVSLQKQRLVAEAAAFAAGNPSPLGAPAGGTSPEQATLQMQVRALDQLITRLQPGRVVIKMESLEQLKGSFGDVTMEERDQITVPLRPQTVNIIGAVRNPTSVVHRAGLRADEYIEQAGGMTAYADKQGIYILRANGSTDTAYARIKDVGTGDTIVVPEQIEPKMKALPLWSAVASILGSVMLGVAAISIIGR